MASGLQCFGCGVQFGMFKREHSCKNCGHIFCSTCSSQSIAIPNQGSSKQRVCFKCYKQITSPPNNKVDSRVQNDLNRPPEPRIEADDFKVKFTREPNIPVCVNDSSDASQSKPRPPLDVDEMIRQRLQKLKEDDTGAKSKVTDEDIGKRFENLSGRKPISQQPNNINSFAPKKTEQEEISDLMDQVTDECRLDDAVNNKGETSTEGGETSEGNKDDVNSDEVQALIKKTMQECERDQNTQNDIEERLAGLKGIDPSVYRNPVPQDIDSDDEEAYNARYLQGVLHEAFLDDKAKAMGFDPSIKQEKPNKVPQDKKTKGKTNVVDSSPYSKPSSIFSKEYEADSDEDELPWCCICNANAVLRCHGCDDDLYCKRCFREGHKDEDPDEHTVSPFRPKKKAS